MHIKSVHLGKKWVCPFCEKIQCSKFSHIRHVSNCKKRKNQEWDPDENSFLLLHQTDLTPEAKTALVNNLIQKDKIKTERINDLSRKLFLALKNTIVLKKQLSQDTQEEEKQVSDLVKAQTDDQPEQNIVFKVPNPNRNEEGEE